MSNILSENTVSSGYAVRVENLFKNYLSGTETINVLQGIDFDAAKGSSVAIRGSSGSGKSTLLNIIGGLDRCDSGTVYVGGINITDFSENQLSLYRQKQIGFIFQFHYLLKDFTALENVMLPAYMTGIKKKIAREKAAMLLEDMKLESRLNHFPSQLSGGERQRVAVARAMVNDPELILADEPTGNLDPQNSAVTADLLFAGAEKWAKTLVIVTHDEKIAGRAMVQFNLDSGLLNPPGDKYQ